MVFTRTACSPTHNYSYDSFLKNVLGSHVFTNAELRKCVWFHLTSADARSYTLVALTGVLQLGRDITPTCQTLSLCWNHVNAKSVYSRRDSASYSAFIVGYKLWLRVGEDAAAAWRPVLEYDW